MKPFDLEAAKNGAPVCTRDGKKAKIIYFDVKGVYPLVTLIDVGNVQIVRSSMANGRQSNTSMSPYDLMMYEKPEPQFKPFDKVLVRNSESRDWRADIFSHREDSDYPYVCLGCVWKYCIPYEGNEHLLGTTNNLEEN